MDIKNRNRVRLQVLLSGALFLLFVGGESIAQSTTVPMNVAMERCGEYSGGPLGSCILCVQQIAGYTTDNPACKDYLPLMNKEIPVGASTAPEVIDPEEMEKEVAVIRARCDRVEQLNCQCWEKEYRENRASGLSKETAATGISSACVSTERIKAFEYPRCVTHEKQWIKIIGFESYCGCVADYVATNTKKDWSVSGGAGAKSLSRYLKADATKACGYGNQEKLSREVANERLEKYGRRGPSLDASAWKNVP